MDNTLLRGRLQVRILPGSPKPPECCSTSKGRLFDKRRVLNEQRVLLLISLPLPGHCGQMRRARSALAKNYRLLQHRFGLLA